ncbi:uncharacterized protein LOC115408468 isoform X2 [Salarias fasciatus]|uniref:uncharacterized protein LOC115408466 isoform X2 n=1 Tax=Salarias fasciatus TaxID=181472 RepID=UPI001176D946|nr:uncharacterized protein LOC115408466 isoform X2 [Salarias fasciatus]XP_029975116.1 uncharacterized protein LOC115408468 isoform X2 [Salarias fasciatus]
MKVFFILVFIGVRVEAQTQLTAAVGGDLVFQCSFGFSGTWKILCRQECQGDGILIQTREDSAQNGRYSVRYDRSSNSVLVHISGVTRSDSGLLLCGLAAQTSTYSVCMAQVSVTAESVPSVENPTVQNPATPSGEPPEGPAHSPAGGAVSLVVVLLLVSLAAFIIYRKISKSRGLKREGTSVETNMEEVLYENCPPDRSQLDYERLDPGSREKQDYTPLAD